MGRPIEEDDNLLGPVREKKEEDEDWEDIGEEEVVVDMVPDSDLELIEAFKE